MKLWDISVEKIDEDWHADLIELGGFEFDEERRLLELEFDDSDLEL